MPACERAEYRVWLEQDGPVVFLHCTVHRWNARVARELRDQVDAMLAAHGGKVYAATQNPHAGDYWKWVRFAVWLGFSFNQTITTADGRQHAIYMRQ